MSADPRPALIYVGWGCLLLAAVVVVAFLGACTGPQTRLDVSQPPSAAAPMECVSGQLDDGTELIFCASHKGLCMYAKGRAEAFAEELTLATLSECMGGTLSLTLDEPDAGPGE